MSTLENKVAIVTGASSGIGKAIAMAFAAEKARVVLAARGQERLEAAAQEIIAAGGTAVAIPADVTAEDDVADLFARVRSTFGRVDLLVNNAGIATNAPADQMTLEQWQSTINVNLTGAFLCSREALRIMRGQVGGRIINIGSVAAKVPRPNTAAYAASKAGLHGLTHALAIEGREYGVTVCMFHPGNTVSGFPAPAGANRPAEPRMAAEDVARMAVAIASMPDDVLVVETVMIPLKMPLLGRG